MLIGDKISSALPDTAVGKTAAHSLNIPNHSLKIPYLSKFEVRISEGKKQTLFCFIFLTQNKITFR